MYFNLIKMLSQDLTKTQKDGIFLSFGQINEARKRQEKTESK